MRKLLIAIGLLALTGLTGCDWFDKPAPVAVTCHCAPPLRGTVAPPPPAASAHVERTRTYRRYAYRGHRYSRHRRYGYRWHKRYAEGSLDIYNYSSHSRSYGGYAYGYGYDYGHRHGHRHHERGFRGHGGHERGFRASTRVWADGYDRRHIYDRSAVRHYVYQARVRRAQEPDRLDPWRGYNDDWDW